MAGTFVFGSFSVFYFMPMLFSVDYISGMQDKKVAQVGGVSTPAVDKEVIDGGVVKPEIVVTHIKTPEPLKAVYMSACYASAPSLRAKLVKMIDDTELNAIVIDVKDYTGTIAYKPTNPKLAEVEGPGCRVKDMQEFVASLHEKGIYTIARITVFQDPYYTKAHPELAVKRASDGGVWKDRKGLAFIDVSAKPYWEYIAALAHETYLLGFDEINFDYIRFPSDGNMKDIAYPWTKNTPKVVALENFYSYLSQTVKPSGAVISADLFGMTTTNTDDLNIGQVLERTMPYFDYVAPMVYPSHYPPGFNGWKNPNHYPYDLIKFVMTKGADRAVADTTTVEHFGGERIGTTTPAIYAKEVYNRDKLRPWLQDFDYGGNYGTAEVRAQINATYDSGLSSWMLWDPGNKYTPSALNAE
ncbi:MAG: putative glycoside hydrolase [Minisyncoccota bacterium]